MRRSMTLLGAVALCLLLAGPLGAETSAQSPAAGACALISVDEPTGTGGESDLLIPDYDLQLGEDFVSPTERSEAASPVPPCPVLRDCPLGNRCGDNRPCQLVGPEVKNDTGNQACQQGGEIKVCPSGQTIHTVTAACAQCPCCSTFPACFCPLNCGTALLKWGCA